MHLPACSALSLLSLVALLIAVPALPMRSAQAGVADEEAERQLDLAHGDLEAGRPARAIKAAQSALRLDPTLVDALLVHALALEAQQDYGKARALALAYRGAAGDDAALEVDDLLVRVDRAQPVRTEIEEKARGKVEVTFAAREHVEDPVLHWRTGRGEWKEAWMERSEQGEWGFALTLDAGAAARLSWWVETGLGEPLMQVDEDGEGRPFRLAVK